MKAQMMQAKIKDKKIKLYVMLNQGFPDTIRTTVSLPYIPTPRNAFVHQKAHTMALMAELLIKPKVGNHPLIIS